MGNALQSNLSQNPSSGTKEVRTSESQEQGVDFSQPEGMLASTASARQIAQLRSLSDASPTVQRITRLSDAQPVQRVGTSDTPSVNVSLEQEMYLLQGQLTTAAKIKGFFGSESTFSKLQKQINLYTSATPEEKERLKPGIRSLGQEWLTKHQTSKDPNDQLKRQSITRIVDALQEADAKAPLELATLSDKVTTGTRLQEAISGKKSTFQEIEPAFVLYQASLSSSQMTLQDLMQLVQRGRHVRELCLEWQRKHGSSTAPADLEKGKSVAQMLGVLEKINVSVFMEPFTAQINGLSLAAAEDGVFSAAEASLSIQLPGGGLASGTVKQPRISSDGIQFSSARLAYSGNLQLGEAIQLNAPFINITQSADGYDIKAGGALALSGSIPQGVTSVSASGKVEVGYDYTRKTFHDPVVENGKLDIELFRSLNLSATGIQYQAGQFTVANGTLTIQALGKTISGTMKDIRYSAAEGLGFSNATLTSESSYTPVEGFNIEQPTLQLRKDGNNWLVGGSGQLGIQWSGGGIELKKLQAHAAVQYDLTKRSLQSFTVERGEMDLLIHDQLAFTVAGFAFDGSTIQAATAGMRLTVFQKEITSTVNNIRYSKAGGLTFDNLTVSSTDTFEPVPGFSIARPTLTLQHTGEQWALIGDGRLGLNVGGATVEILKAEADAHLAFNLTSKSVSEFSVKDASVDVRLFNGIRITGEQISYQDGILTIGTAAIALESANPLGDAVSGKATNVRLSKVGVEWTELMVNVGKAIEFGKFAFTPPKGIIRKEADSYLVIMEEASGTLTLADWLSATGTASMQWGPKQNRGIPEITAASLTLTGQSKQFPGDFLPMWPLQFGFEASILAGPVPLTGGVRASVNGGTSFKVAGNVGYQAGQFTFGGSLTMDPSIELELRVYAGAGIPLLVYIGGYLSGKAITEADVEVGLKGSARADAGYSLDALSAYYKINADFLAKVSAGIEARALYFFQKDLFEIVIKEWQLGHASLEGERSLLSPNKMQPLSATGLLDRNNKKLPSPDVAFHTRSYAKAIRILFEALEAEGLANGKPGIISAIEKEGATETAPLETGRAQLKKLAFDAVANSFDKSEIEKMVTKLSDYENQFREMERHYQTWLGQQKQKMDEAPETGGNRSWRGHLQNKPHYRKKIESGARKHERVTAEKQQRIKLLQSKIEAFQAQTAMSSAIFSQLDALLDPNNTLSVTDIQAQVDAYIRHIRVLKGQIPPQMPDVTSEADIDYDQADPA